MDGSARTLTIGCETLRCRLEGFEDPFSALAALAPWLGEVAREGGMDAAGAPPWVQAQAQPDAIVLRPAEARPTPRRAPSPFDPEADSIVFQRWDGGEGPRRTPLRTGPEAGSAAKAPQEPSEPPEQVSTSGPPASRAAPGNPEEEMLARLARRPPDPDERRAQGDRDGAPAPAEERGDVPTVIEAGEPISTAPPARTSPDPGAPGSEPSDPPPDASREEEPDRIVVRLAEAAGAHLDAPEAERRRASLRHLRHAAQAEMDDADARGGEEPFRDALHGAPVRPRRPRVPRPPVRGAQPPAGGPRGLPPLVLGPEMRVPDEPGPISLGGRVRPRRVAPGRS